MPIGRFRTHGDTSGQAFREDILYPKICEAIKNKDTLEIDLEGMLGLNSTFLEESFGGLVREHGMNPDEILKTIKFLPGYHLDLYVELAQEYIQEAAPGKEPSMFLKPRHTPKGPYINIAREFTPMPIGRFRTHGDTSGQTFREDILYPKICEAIKNKDTLEIDLEGMLGLNSTFLEESFGGLVREHGMNPDEILKTVKFLPGDNLDLYVELAQEYIQEAAPGKEPSPFREY